MDNESIIAGKNALLIGLALFLGSWIGWHFFVFSAISSDMYEMLWWIFFPTSIFGLVLILIGVNWIIKGLAHDENEHSTS